MYNLRRFYIACAESLEYLVAASDPEVATESRNSNDVTAASAGSVQAMARGQAVIGIKSSSKHIGQDSPGLWAALRAVVLVTAEAIPLKRSLRPRLRASSPPIQAWVHVCVYVCVCVSYRHPCQRTALAFPPATRQIYRHQQRQRSPSIRGDLLSFSHLAEIHR